MRLAPKHYEQTDTFHNALCGIAGHATGFHVAVLAAGCVRLARGDFSHAQLLNRLLMPFHRSMDRTLVVRTRGYRFDPRGAVQEHCSAIPHGSRISLLIAVWPNQFESIVRHPDLHHITPGSLGIPTHAAVLEPRPARHFSIVACPTEQATTEPDSDHYSRRSRRYVRPQALHL